MEQWQDAATRQLRLLSSRLNEALSGGLELLRSELGVDLGLKAELIPPWLVLSAACGGLLLMLLLWASVCRGLFRRRAPPSAVDDGGEVTRGVGKPVKAEEPKKKKKKSEKKAQSNGRAVAEAQEEAVVSEETVLHQPPSSEVKAEKVAETKKSKKKGKQSAKDTKAAADGKEPEEGTWETKVSNKEKREQRKKDKNSSDGSASPGGGNTPVNNPPEPPKEAAPPAPANQKKKKGESTKVKVEKVEKVEAPVPQVNSKEAAPVAAHVSELPVNVPAQNISPKPGTWTAPREPVSLWRAELDESWTVIDRGLTPSEMNLSFSGLGVRAADPHPVSELPWLTQPRVDDEWSGLNSGSADPSSDWNAPSEAWGNFDEPNHGAAPAQVQTPPEPAKDKDEDEKDKGEAVSDGSAKAKKKKKKKKKADEEGAGQGEEPEKDDVPVASVKKQPPPQDVAAVQPVKTATAEVRAERPLKENISSKPTVTQVPLKPNVGEPTAKQNSLPTSIQQKKPEESQAPKPAKKKKARRET